MGDFGDATAAGGHGQAYGSGGGGGQHSGSSGNSTSGGNGKAGIVYVEEFK